MRPVTAGRAAGSTPLEAVSCPSTCGREGDASAIRDSRGGPMFKDKAEPKRDEVPNLLAVWPGMGHVALTAGFYLMSKLHMHEEEPLDTGDLFDLEHVDVEKGLARAGHIPVSH